MEMSIAERKIYAVPGENCTTYAYHWHQPPGTVEMIGPNPDPDLYIASSDGTWVIGDYKTARKNEILKVWPVDKQLEAITESADGRHEKMIELQKFLEEIKNKYPKPEEL